MHGPWHMPEHPDERDDGGAQERRAEEDRIEAHAQAASGGVDPARCTASNDFLGPGNAGFNVYVCLECGWQEWL